MEVTAKSKTVPKENTKNEAVTKANAKKEAMPNYAAKKEAMPKKSTMTAVVEEISLRRQMEGARQAITKAKGTK